jgi:pimeloyl-ACP methyl ester carboxylesterase
VSKGITSILDIRALRIEKLMGLRALSDGTIFGEVAGDGLADVLALHGWGRRGSDFVAAFKGLSYLAVDLPGFGASPRPVAPMGARGYADAIEPALEHLTPKPILVGHSFGGRVAVALAASHPERFAGLVLTGVPLLRRASPSRSPVMFRLGRWAAKRGLIGDKRIESLRQKHGSPDYRAATGVMREVLVMSVNESYETELSQIASPVVLLWGANDAEVPWAVAESAASILRGAGTDVRLLSIDGVGHHVPIEAPQSLRDSVDEMLAQWAPG